MRRINCPYIGLKEDPTTALGFPSEGNFCHHVRPIAPVKNDYQEKYCLSPEHTACPIYRAVQPQPLPLALVAPAFLKNQGKRVAALLSIPATLAMVAIFVFLSSLLLSRMNVLGQQIPRTGNRPDSNNAGLFNLALTSKPTEHVPNTPAAGQAQVTKCSMPQNWMQYTVNPTDSLVRLSVVYGASIEQLQAANCMGNNTVILPGQVIFVPFVPTNTVNATIGLPNISVLDATATNTLPPIQRPTAVPTSTPQPPQPTAPPSPTNTVIAPTSKPSNTPVPTSTPVPPTYTPQPPTSTPVLPTPTNPPPTATKKPKPTKAPTATQAPAPTDTPLPPPTVVPTDQPTPTIAPADIPTDTPAPQPTATQAPMDTATPDPTADQ